MALSRGPLPPLDPHVSNRARQPAQTQSRSPRHGPLRQGVSGSGGLVTFWAGCASRVRWVIEHTGGKCRGWRLTLHLEKGMYSNENNGSITICFLTL